MIDLVVVLGAGLVLPVALRSWPAAWVGVAVSTALALAVTPGPVGLALALPWLVVAGAATVRSVAALLPARLAAPRAPRAPGPSGRAVVLDAVAAVAAPAFAVVAGVALAESCGALGLVSYGEPITRLAVVHFTFAGTATTVLAAMARRRARPRWRAVATVGLLLAVAAPPVVALGFATGAAVPQVGGAVLMTAAAYAVAVAHLAEGVPARATTVGRLLVVSGLSVWVPMVLAVAWALAQHTGGPALSIPDMVRVHGSLNAFGFVGCGLAARWLADHRVVPVAPSTITPTAVPVS